MKPMRTFAVAAIIAFTSWSAYAGDVIDGLGKQVNASLAQCRMDAELAIQQQQLEINSAKLMRAAPNSVDNGNVAKCIFDQKIAITEKYKGTIKSLGKNNLAIDALKSYLAFALMALETVEPQPGERRIDYSSRLNGSDITLSEMLNRVKIELM